MSDQQRNAFDGLYRRSPNYYGAPSDGLQQCVEKYSVAPGRALDVGCGQGRNALWLADIGFDVTALDVSPVAIQATREIARERGLQLRVEVADFADFDIQAREYGLVVAVTTFNHIAATQWPVVAARVTEALAVGGLLYAVVFTTNDPGHHSEAKGKSECADLVTHYFEPGELAVSFPRLKQLEYTEYEKEDLSHGPRHVHAKGKLIARRDE